MSRTMRRVCELGGYQVAWVLCALAASQGSALLSLLATGTFIVLQTIFNPASISPVPLVASGLAGAAMESMFAFTGVLTYSAPWPVTYAAPVWIVGLWLAFGTTLGTTAAALGAHPVIKAAVFGALFAPLAYSAGAGLGAIQIAEPRAVSFAVIACAWIIALPALMSLHLRMNNR